MSSLSEKQRLYGIVPIRCGCKSGTAFFLKEGKLLTAVHVVVEFFTNRTAVLVSFDGESIIRFRAEYVDKVGMKDVAILSPLDDISDYYKENYLPLLSIPFEHSKEMSLLVIGYPKELGHGTSLIDLKVKAYSRVTGKKYDIVTVREDNFEMRNYGGFSGSPVVNENGYVVGVVSTENYGKLTYCSIENICDKLKKMKVSVSEDWATFDGTDFSKQKSREQVQKACRDAGNRYHKNEHIPNIEVTNKVKAFADYEKYHYAEKFLTDVKDELDSIRELSTTLALKKFDNGVDLSLLPYYIDELSKDKNNISYKNILDKLKEKTVKQTTAYNSGHKRFLLMYGIAGTGKTHFSCKIAELLNEHHIVYLLFGSQFNIFEDVEEQILKLLFKNHRNEELKYVLSKINDRATSCNCYAFLIIDALNEGAGDEFWLSYIGRVINLIKEYDHLKMIVTIRKPYETKILRAADEKEWERIILKGFVSKKAVISALDKYLKKEGIDKNYVRGLESEFKLPLFLIIFCQSFQYLTRDERNNIKRTTLFEKYLKARNIKVAAKADEDEKRCVAFMLMEKLAEYSVDHCNAGLIPRDKARIIADRICPRPLWSNNLLHAMLDENLLMDTLADNGVDEMVMFEFENIADVMKAQYLLKSNLTDQDIVCKVSKMAKDLGTKGLSNSKFMNMVVALIAMWDRNTKITSFPVFTTGVFKGFVKRAIDNYKEESHIKYLKGWLNRNRKRYDLTPFHFLHELDNDNSSEFHDLDIYLSNLQMSKRDEKWTIFVNNYFDRPSSWEYIERLSHDDERAERFLLLAVWMLTTSYPESRDFLIRVIYRVMSRHLELVTTFMEKFIRCDDDYVLTGLYCAIYGVVLRNMDTSFVSDVAEKVYNYFYANEMNVTPNIVLRQWTIKILERAYYLDAHADYFMRLKRPFLSFNPDDTKLDKDPNDHYFGNGKGAFLLFDSIFGFSDFNRYILGRNSFMDSHEFYSLDENSRPKPLELQDIARMMAPIIKKKYQYSSVLDEYDGPRFSPDRMHNVKERIGKKYQWLALWEVYGQLTDHYLFYDNEKNEFFGEASIDRLTNLVWPWETKMYDRFDPTMPSSDEMDDIKRFARLGYQESLDLAPNNLSFKDWIDSCETNPLVNVCYFDEQGFDWICLYGFNSTENTENNEKRSTLLFYNSSFVREKNSLQMEKWAAEKDFSGRWMEERTDNIDFRWNEMPWSESYKRLGRGDWVKPESYNEYPCELMVAYDEQLQEEVYGFIEKKDYHSFSSAMPCAEMMEVMELYTAERGVVRRKENGEIVALCKSATNLSGIGLIVRKDVLCNFMKKQKYRLFIYISGNKQVREGGYTVLDSVELSGCLNIISKGELRTVQDLRIVKR